MSLPPKYGLWVERRGASDGRWHSCYGVGGALCFLETEAELADVLHGGRDNSHHYSARLYDPVLGGGQTVHAGHFHGLPLNLTKLSADVFPIGIRQARHAFNPSIVAHDGCLYVTLRSLEDNRRTSRNYLGRLFMTGEIEDVREIEEIGVEDRRSFEDIRLVVRNGRLWATATLLNPRPCVAVLELDDNGGVFGVHVQNSPRDEKNWAPFVEGGKLRFVYSTDPTLTVLDFDDAVKRVTPNVRDLRSAVHAYRGGSQVIEWEGGYLYVVHHVNLVDGYPVYLHRLIKCDKTMTRARASAPFFIHSTGIEFVAGAASMFDDLVLSFGLADQSAYLAVVRREEVARLFHAE